MTYNPEKYTAAPTPKAGTKIKAKVTKVEDGLLGSFVDAEILKGWKNADPTSPAINVTVEGDYNGTPIKRSRTLTLPADGVVQGGSNLGKWKRLYGAYPTEGQEVMLNADEQGYFQFLL